MNNSQYGLLKISGLGAKPFLQGQLTCHMDELSACGNLAAHCSPQGRVISLFKLYLYDNDFYILIPLAMLDLTKKCLEKYSAFYKVSLNDVTDTILHLAPLLGIENLNNIEEQDIYAGIPTIYPATSGIFLPHELNLLNLNAVSLTKGCFTGQEIIARMHYKGKLKTKLFSAKGESDSPPELGADIYSATGTPCGKIVNCFHIPSKASHSHSYRLLVVCATDEESVYLDPNHTQSITLMDK